MVDLSALNFLKIRAGRNRMISEEEIIIRKRDVAEIRKCFQFLEQYAVELYCRHQEIDFILIEVSLRQVSLRSERKPRIAYNGSQNICKFGENAYLRGIKDESR